MTSTSESSQTPGDREHPERPNSTRGQTHNRIWIPLVLFACVVSGWLVWSVWFNPAHSARQSLQQAYRAHRDGDYARAEQLAASVLKSNPDSGEAALLAARCAAAQENFEQAVVYLGILNSEDREELLQASLLKAEWTFRRLAHLTDAERAYREALTIDPENLEANRGLVELLSICGRSREAIPSILRILRQDPNSDLLILLLRDEGAIGDLQLLRQAHRNAPNDPLPLIGLAWHSSSDGKPLRALEFLQQAVSRAPGHEAAQLALGRQLLALSRYDELLEWYRDLPVRPVERAEFWILSGQLAEHFGQRESAIRCHWEAVRIAPELDRPHIRLIALLNADGQSETAKMFAARLQDLLRLDNAQSRILLKARQSSIEEILELADAYQAAGRIWEAHAWCRLAIDLDPGHEAARRLAADLQSRLNSLPLQLTVDTANVALRVNLSDYPLPDFATTSAPSAHSVDGTASVEDIAFQDEASTAGLQFKYFNGTEGELTRKMYEFTGGGIGVIDFDCDGRPDVCFSQGCPWPPGSVLSSHQDRLFRNISGSQFIDVSAPAGIEEHDFGQGVAVGDIDSDGFPDLLIANIGRNRLWKNNGDGTFTDATAEAGISGNEWSTSCLMADLDGDGDTDLYVANYLSGDDLFDRVCRHSQGGAIACLPAHFSGAVDSLWLNQGELKYSRGNETMLSAVPDGKGLGVAAWDADRSGRLSLLVANDTTPNLLFVPAPSSDGAVRFVEQGILSGIAVNSDGKAEGCMGIAIGDVDSNGFQDVHITNFLAESNTLYTASQGPLFEDRTAEFNLRQPTFNRLGFGTQFLDVNLDGRLELFVTNGHVDDLRRYGRPYRMPPQLFYLDSDRFEEIDPRHAGPYFQQQWLGRASATVDWNGDHLDDLIVGHLDSNYALLTNRSKNAGHFLTLRLIGTASSRDAAGTRVTLQCGERIWHSQLIAGGSYHSSSRHTLTFGLGDARRIDRLTIEWHSGTSQEFSALPVSQPFVLVEGQSLLPDLTH